MKITIYAYIRKTCHYVKIKGQTWKVNKTNDFFFFIRSSLFLDTCPFSKDHSLLVVIYFFILFQFFFKAISYEPSILLNFHGNDT